MNRERLTQLADAIEASREDLDFDMKEWIGEGDCGTAACIAGWACAVFAPKDWRQMMQPNQYGGPRGYSKRGQVADVAAKELGFLGYWEGARSLFNPTGWLHASRDKAVRVLRHAASTGTIDWSV